MSQQIPQMSLPICQHFMNNACRFGDLCTKLHPGGVEARRGPPNLPLCTHFLQGRCAYGDKCIKQHLRADEAKQRALGFALGGVAPQGQVPGSESLSTAGATSSTRNYQDLLGRRLRGVIKSINVAPEASIIACPEVFQLFRRDVSAAAEEVSSLVEGHEVSFDLFLNPQRLPQAKSIVPETYLPGRIDSLDQSSGYGFISCPVVFAVFKRNVLVREDLIHGFEVGQDVLFTMTLKDKRKQPQAKAVKAMSSSA
jgi:cold shock CspA family protein